MSDVRTVAVMGSCISRDNFNRTFNPDYKTWFRVGDCSNQSSMIALMAPPVTRPWEPVQEMKPYGLWNVHSDLSREILTLLAAQPPDVLVLDFFGDVHFGVLRAEDGTVATNNRWRLWKTDLHQQLLAEPGTETLRWQDDPDRYFSHWREAMDRFAAHLREHCPDTLVVVHHGFNTHHKVGRNGINLKPLGDQKVGRHRQWVNRANRFWARLDAHASTAYGWASIDLRDEWYATYADHPWGPFDVHYTPDYYHRFLAELHALEVGRELGGPVAAEVERLRLAARERPRAEAAFWLAQLADATQPRTGWSRLQRRTPLQRPETGTGSDHALLAGLTQQLPDEAAGRLATLPASADEHVAWLRRVWQPRVERARARG